MERLTRHESCKKRSRTWKQRPVNSWHWGTTLHYPCVRPWVLSVSSPVRVQFLLTATQKVFPDPLPKWPYNFVHGIAQREQIIWDFMGWWHFLFLAFVQHLQTCFILFSCVILSLPHLFRTWDPFRWGEWKAQYPSLCYNLKSHCMPYSWSKWDV